MAGSRKTDLSAFDGRLQREGGKQARLARYFGEIVSAASVLPAGTMQLSPLRCRRRPNRQPCAGQIEVGRCASNDAIEWRCAICGDQGMITNWRDSRWDLGPELSSGQVVSLSAVRARRAMLACPAPATVYEIMTELIDGPVALDHLVLRKLRISGDQTLHDLHRVVAQAYDRRPDDPYEFMFGALYEVDARRFTGVGGTSDLANTSDLVGASAELAGASDLIGATDALCETQHLRIDDLDLQLGQVFGYLADFDAEWVHRLTVLSMAKGPPGARVLERVGHVPDLAAEQERWDGDLVWEEIEDDYPMTELYGPYTGDDPPDRAIWSAMEELERLLLVLEGHNRALPADHEPIDSLLLHAVVHHLAESALCSGDTKAARHLQRCLRRGLPRHLAVHEVGERIALDHLASGVDAHARSKKR